MSWLHRPSLLMCSLAVATCIYSWCEPVGPHESCWQALVFSGAAKRDPTLTCFAVVCPIIWKSVTILYTYHDRHDSTFTRRKGGRYNTVRIGLWSIISPSIKGALAIYYPLSIFRNTVAEFVYNLLIMHMYTRLSCLFSCCSAERWGGVFTYTNTT